MKRTAFWQISTKMGSKMSYKYGVTGKKRTKILTKIFSLPEFSNMSARGRLCTRGKNNDLWHVTYKTVKYVASSWILMCKLLTLLAAEDVILGHKLQICWWHKQFSYSKKSIETTGASSNQIRIDVAITAGG